MKTQEEDPASDSDEPLDFEQMRVYLENEIDNLNPHPEENSDFDSDSEVHPIDSISVGAFKPGKISSENSMKRKPIQVCIIGRPNVGKSTLVNALLKENRVIVNDLPGTTRDSVYV